MDVDTNAIKHGLQHDISAFIKQFSSLDHIKYADFVDQWIKYDFSLLTVVSSPDSILQILLQAGLFIPTRPFRDHQLLVFFLFNLFKASKQPLKLSADRIQFLLGVRLRAKTWMEMETTEALDVLFKRGAFLILAEDRKTNTISYINTQFPSSNTVSVEQLLDRIKRIESFLQSRPLFDQKLSKNSLTRLKTLFERYHESKLKTNLLSQEKEDQFASSMGIVMKIVEGYEKLVHRFVGSIPLASSSAKPRSVRSRLTQSSLTPIIPASAAITNDSLPEDFFMTMPHRSQSVPVTKMSKRSSSALREVNLNELINENSNLPSANMPNLDFF